MTQNKLPTSPPAPGVKRLFTYWLILGIVGLVFPILVYFLIRSNYFIRWHIVTQAPEDTAQLVVGDYGGLLARTTSGQSLSCYSESPGCWKPDVSPTWAKGEPCNLRSAPFNPIAGPPKNMIECIFSKGSYAEVEYTVLYVRDQQGNIWKWEKAASAYEMILLPILAVIGAIIGVLVGSVVWAVRRVSARKKLPQNLAP
jgi:hypothetical protein